MTDPRLYHQIGTHGRDGIPAWWFGAPAIAFVYALIAPRFVPDIVSVPETLPNGVATPMRWFVGLLVGVALLSTWRLLRLALTR